MTITLKNKLIYSPLKSDVSLWYRQDCKKKKHLLKSADIYHCMIHILGFLLYESQRGFVFKSYLMFGSCTEATPRDELSS